MLKNLNTVKLNRCGMNKVSIKTYFSSINTYLFVRIKTYKK